MIFRGFARMEYISVLLFQDMNYNIMWIPSFIQIGLAYTEWKQTNTYLRIYNKCDYFII